MSGEDEKSGARDAIILAVIVIVVAIYSTTYGLQSLEWFAAHRWATANPWIAEMPQVLPAGSATALAPATPVLAVGSKGKKAAPAMMAEPTAYTYEFSAPWPGKWTEKASAGSTEFRFDSGQVIVFFDPDAQMDIVHLLRESNSASYAPYQTLVNDGGLSTNYALYQAVYGAAPSRLAPMMNYAEAQRDNVLLLTKLSFGYDLAGKLYSFDFGENKGFQFGDPAHGAVAVRVFNTRDKHFRFIFTVAAGSSGQIAQSDINRAVSSLQLVRIS